MQHKVVHLANKELKFSWMTGPIIRNRQGARPYGTLLFNVLENGQPRWQALPTQIIDEGSIGTLSLLPFLSDTDSTGNIVSAEDLTLEIIQMSTNDVFEACLLYTSPSPRDR